MKRFFQFLSINPGLLLALFFGLFLVSCEDTIDIQEYGIISGSVHDALTGAPIAGVSISTNPASNIVLSDEEGNFSITQVPAGDITLSAKKLYYKTYSVSINVQPESVKETAILLEQSDSYQLPSGNLINPEPADGSMGTGLTDTIRWQLSTVCEEDSITYNFRLYEAPETNAITEFFAMSDTFALVTDLKYNHTYYWQVSAVLQDSVFANSKLWSFTTVDFPALSVLFARKDGEIYNIYGTDSSFSEVFQLTNGVTNTNWYPKSNPVTGNIAFVSNRNTSMQIYTMTDEGEEIKKVTVLNVTGNYNEGTGFCWSPDGSMLLYPHYNKLYRINADGTGLLLIATAPPGRHFTSCDWSDYTDKIVVATTGNNPYENELYLMNSNGSNMALFVADLPGVIQNPVFSVDGQKVLFTRDADGLNAWDGRQLNARMYLQGINDTISIDLSSEKEEGTNDLMPRFSPDGAMLIFVNTSNIPTGKHSIYSADLEGNNRRLIIDNATMPEWVTPIR